MKRKKTKPSQHSKPSQLSKLFLKPRTRHQEVLCLLLEEKQPISYVEMCDELDNVNCHKSIQFWRDRGIDFKKKIITRQNRFHRHGHFFKFSIKNRAKAKSAYKRNVMRID